MKFQKGDKMKKITLFASLLLVGIMLNACKASKSAIPKTSPCACYDFVVKKG